MENALVPLPVKTPSLPRAVISASTKACEYVVGKGVVWTPKAALEEMGALSVNLPQYLADAERALAPAGRPWLMDRLSTMQLAMTQGWSEQKTTAWLHETARLLGDLPQDIVDAALDEAVKASDRGFVPSIGAIRTFADPKLADRQRIVSRLRTMSGYEPERVEPADRPWESLGNVARRLATPDEIAAIKEEVGLKTEHYPVAPPPRGPARRPTVEDYVELGLSREDAEHAVANFDRTEREMKEARSEGKTPRRDQLLRENGHFLLAKCIAQRFVSRRRAAFDPKPATDLGRQMIAKHGAPPLGWLLSATRQLVAELRFDFSG